MCVRDYSYGSVCTHGLGTPTVSKHILERKKTSQIVIVLLMQSGDLESGALPTEPPRHPKYCHQSIVEVVFVVTCVC